MKAVAKNRVIKRKDFVYFKPDTIPEELQEALHYNHGGYMVWEVYPNGKCEILVRKNFSVLVDPKVLVHDEFFHPEEKQEEAKPATKSRA